MPIYQYKCADCNIEKDVVRGILESTPDPTCQRCKKPLKRIYSPIEVSFNGSGFYSKEK
jgi:putative FmdB family regulatory protein